MSGAVRLTHRISGSGPPVVLLNGGMMSVPAWEPLARHLRPHYTLLGFDFRGQLLSLGQPPADLAGHARDVVRLLDEVSWPDAHLVGVSFGGEVAVEMAATFPTRARSLMVVTAMDRETPEFRAGSERMRERIAEVRAGGGTDRFYAELVSGVYSDGFVGREAAALAARGQAVSRLPMEWFEGVEGILDALLGFDLGPRLAAVRCPVLAVHAGDDRVMAPERSRALAQGLRAEIVEHPTAGHGLVAEEPEWLANVLLEFLARQERRQAAAAAAGR